MAVTYILTHTSTGEELADVDVSQLTRHEAHDLRLELTQQIFHKLDDFDEETEKFYIRKIEEIKTFLGED